MYWNVVYAAVQCQWCCVGLAEMGALLLNKAVFQVLHGSCFGPAWRRWVLYFGEALSGSVLKDVADVPVRVP